MDNKKSIITLKDYLAKSKVFKIPDYQRGYIWGKNRRINNKEDQDSVTYMLESIYEGYVSQVPIFMQGVTVCEDRDTITIIDGQQRTTFFYLLLCYLEYNEKFVLDYVVREDSKDFLNNIKGKNVEEILSLCTEDKDERYQDIFFFKKTIRIIHEQFDKWAIDTVKLKDYLLTNIQFLYIDIPEDKARTVFTMMNGNKANMTDEDLVKAEILRMVSLDVDDSEIVRREQDLLRSRYAREWDRWLRWWNQSKVQDFYKLHYFYKSDKNRHPLVLLLSTYHHAKLHDESETFNFENFRAGLLLSKSDAKRAFMDLRHLQKKFEDVYNDVKSETHLHNTVGGILTVLKKEYAVQFAYDYFSRPMPDTELDQVFKLSFMGNLTYREISNIAGGEQKEDTIEGFEMAKYNLKQAINDDNIYQNGDYKEIAFRQLLLLNIEYDSQLGRMFNFSAYEKRSIEHIFPKSKVYYTENEQNFSCEDGNPVSIDSHWINVADLQSAGCSQHGMGNFALLYTVNNSQLGNKSFAEKKKILFGTANDIVDVFQSRELLHTISLFSSEKWGVQEISANKTRIINKLESYYGI